MEITKRTIEEAEKLGYKELALLLGISKPAACKKLSNKRYTLLDADKILGKYRLMFLDRK